MEFSITNTHIYGLHEAVIASGNSYRTQFREVSDLNPADWTRATKLGNVAPGTGHDAFLNGITVVMDVTAPLYWWKQAQRYHWLEFVSSQSTMHCVLKFDIKNQCVADTDERVIVVIQSLINEYNNQDDAAIKSKLWYKIIASLPCGFCLGATMTTSYRQLKTIYLQRKDHRLKEWHVFADWCLSLPQFKGLCLPEK